MTIRGLRRRVAFYSRYSTDQQNFSSIEGQERLCAKYAEGKDWIETKRYSDAARSGTTTMGRSGLFAMLAAAERGEFDILLMEDLDRASRDAADMFWIAKQLDELDIVFCTVAGGVVTDIELAFKAVQSQQFIKQNVAKSMRGQENAIASGRMSGSIAYGYRKIHQLDGRGEPVNGLREVDPTKALVVERIHADLDAGKTTFQICKALNTEGVEGPKGKPWRPGTLLGNRNGGLGILRNPIYIGEYQFRKTHRKRRKGEIKMRFTDMSERMIMQHPHLAIIDREVWDRNQARLAASFDRPFHAKKKMRYVFTGKVFCGDCHSTCIVSDGKFVCTGHNQKGICGNTRRVFREQVEATLLSRIKDHLLSEALIEPSLAVYRQEAEQARTEYLGRVQSTAARMAQIDKDIASITRKLIDIDDDTFTSKMLSEEMEKLGLEKARLTQGVGSEPSMPIQDLDAVAVVERIGQTLDNLQAELEGDDREASRATEIIRRLVDKIILTPTPGTVSDGRGAGDLLVTVVGPLADLIELADLPINRVTKREHGPMLGFGNVNVVWTFIYPLLWEDPRAPAMKADDDIIAHLLDVADVPVSVKKMEEAMQAAGGNGDGAHAAKRHVRNALARLVAEGLARTVKWRGTGAGYVWNYRGMSDEQWKERVASPPMTMAIPSISLSAPAAVPVVVGRRRSDETG